MTRRAICLLLAIGLLTVTIGQGQQLSDQKQGTADALTDAGLHTNELLWGAAGFVFGVLGVFASYMIHPSPPVSRLLGKSPEYLEAYGQTFTNRAQGIQRKAAWIGCLISAVLWTSYTVMLNID